MASCTGGERHLPPRGRWVRYESDLGRRQVAAEALEKIDKRPLTGEGFEFAQAAHNIYLQVLVVGGPLALLSFLAVSGLILRSGLRALQTARGTRNGPLLAGLAGGYAGYLASGAFDNILWDRYLWAYDGLLIVPPPHPSRPALPLRADGALAARCPAAGSRGSGRCRSVPKPTGAERKLAPDQLTRISAPDATGAASRRMAAHQAMPSTAYAAAVA